jgi:hypothetical protein
VIAGHKRPGNDSPKIIEETRQYIRDFDRVAGTTTTARSYYRKLWNRCRDEKGGVPFRVDHANPGGSRVEGDATDAEGNGQWGWKGSRRATF